MCKIACSVGGITKNEANYPRGKALILFTVIKGIKEFDEDIAEKIYQCSICGLCQDWCISDYEIPGLIVAARRDIVEKKKVPSRILRIYENIKNTGSPLGKSYTHQNCEKVAFFSKKNKEKRKVEVLYFPGDTFLYFPEVVEATIDILTAAKVNFSVKLNEKNNNCGELLYQLGFHEEARRIARENTEIIKNSGCKIVLVSEADEYLAFTRDYPKLGINLNSSIRIMHVVEYIDLLLRKNDLILIGEINKSVTYHDSPGLGRYSGIYEPPRRVIKSIPGIKFKEMRWNRNRADCCGASGGLLFTYPEIAKKMAENVIKKAKDMGVEIILTSSSLCKLTFTTQKKCLQKNNVKVYDITEIVAKLLR